MNAISLDVPLPVWARPVPRPRFSHPGLVFSVVWTIAFGTWWLLPNSSFIQLTHAQKVVSTVGVAYMLAAVGAFVIGAIVAPVLLPSTALPRRIAADAWLLGACRRGTKIALVIGLTLASYMVLAGMARAGGPGPIISAIAHNQPWPRIVAAYFKPVYIQGITVWVHLIIAVAPLSTMGFLLARRLGVSRRFFAVSFILGIAGCAVIGFVFDERLILFDYIVAVLTAWVGFHFFVGERIHFTAFARRALVVLALLAGIWFGSNFFRSYVPHYATATGVIAANAPSPAASAWNTFVAYMIASSNNGVYAAQHDNSPSYGFSTFNGAITTLKLDTPTTPAIGEGIIESNNMLSQMYGSQPLTTFSLPGLAFIDWSWAGIGLLFWFGMIAGRIYQRCQQGALWAALVYPLVMVGVLDSFRIMYWTETSALVPLALLLFVCSRVYARRGSARVHD